MSDTEKPDEDIIATNISATDGLPSPEKGLIQELARVLTSVSAVESQGSKQVTVRQVGPLVLVLTGATFLNVGNHNKKSIFINLYPGALGSSCSYSSASD